MTIQNYTNTELLLAIQQLNYSPKKISKIIKYEKHNPLIDELINRTTFLDSFFEEKKKPTPFLARLYCIEHDILEHPICNHPNCNNKVNWNVQKREFCQHCCCQCGALDPIVQNKVITTSIERYGVQHATQSSETRDKFKQTCLKKYGVDNPSKSIQVLNKIKQTTFEHYGVEYSQQSNEIREKSIKTILEKYGVDHPLKSKEIQDKIKQTNLEKYGVEHPAQLDEIKNKMKQTNLKNLGVDWSMQCEDIRNKSKETNIDKYGVENPMQSKEIQDKSKETCLKKYGVEYSFQSDVVKEKSKQTCIQKYGVDNYSKTHEFHKKSRKHYVNDKYPNMTFASSWEFKVYDFLVEHNIDFEYQPSISFEYYYCDIKHTYHPDFKIGDKIYEVKGDHFFRVNESTGKEEMYCPYRKDEWSNEYYDYLCKKEEAKHQCMLSNNVIILRKPTILNLTINDFTS